MNSYRYFILRNRAYNAASRLYDQPHKALAIWQQWTLWVVRKLNF